MRRVCFHHCDSDGYCSAAVVLRKYPDAICVPAGYSKEFPVEHITSEKDQAIIVDYSFSDIEELKTIQKKTNNIIWIDHHVTSFKLIVSQNMAFENRGIPGSSRDQIAGIRVNNTPAACVLCWQYFFSNEPVPLAINMVSDYDTWTFSYGEVTRLFSKGLLSHGDPKDRIWQELFGPLGEFRVNELVEEGRIIKRYEDYVNLKIMENASFETIFHGHSAVVCNSMWGNKDVFKSGPEKDVYIKMYFDGEFWNVTLYSSKVDCEKLAKMYGGGGHCGASGFKTKAFPFWKEVPLNMDVMNG